MSEKKNSLIVALDVETFAEARVLIDQLNNVEIFKIGSQLFTACGPAVVRYVLAQGKKVFLDLKFHDIPNTVANAVRSATAMGQVMVESVEGKKERIEPEKTVFMLTVHIIGGKEMLQRAVEAAKRTSEELNVPKPVIVGITVLTSDANTDNIQKVVMDRATLAQEAGLDGVVASSQEAAILREKFGNDFIIVTPGIRPFGADVGDQKRVTTPLDAIKNGSDFLVVGRPIVKADDPTLAAKNILEEIESVKK